MKFRVSPRAGAQIRVATEWWRDHRPFAPSLLEDELEAAFAFIRSLPAGGELAPRSRIKGLRRVLLGRTQYHVYYLVHEGEAVIEVLALWHTSRGKPPRL